MNNDDSDSEEENRFIELQEDDGGDLKIVQSRENSLSPPTSPPVSPPVSPKLKVTETSNNNIDEALLTPVDNHKKHEVYIMLNSDSKFLTCWMKSCIVWMS